MRRGGRRCGRKSSEDSKECDDGDLHFVRFAVVAEELGNDRRLLEGCFDEEDGDDCISWLKPGARLLYI
jgi:hypothetical protein